MARSEGFQHGREHSGGFGHGHTSETSLHRDTHKTDLGDRGGQKLNAAFFLAGGDPPRGSFVVHMIFPAPRDQHIDVEQVIHGKSASNSRVDATVSGGNFPAGSKIKAPV